MRPTRGSLAPLLLHLNGSGHGFQQRTELHFINAEVTLQALHADVAAAVDQHVTVYCGEVHGCGLLSTSGASTVLAHDRASFSALCIHNRNAAGLVRVTMVGRLPLGVSERAMPPDATLGAAEARCLGFADVVGSATELSVESRRLKQQLGHVHSLVSRANQAEPHSGELSKGSTCRMPSVQFDTASGVASVQVGASLNAAAVHRAVYALIPLENILRSVVVHVAAVASSPEQISRAVGVLNRLCVPVVCSTHGEIPEAVVAFCLALDYSVSARRAPESSSPVLQSLKVTVIDAQRVAVVNESVLH